MKSPLIAAALIASFAVPTAIAGSTTEAFEVKVQIDRSALDDPSTLADEYANIRKQVTEQCKAEHEGFTPLQNFIAVRGCVNKTMDNTVREIGHQDLAKLHTEERFG